MWSAFFRLTTEFPADAAVMMTLQNHGWYGPMPETLTVARMTNYLKDGIAMAQGQPYGHFGIA